MSHSSLDLNYASSSSDGVSSSQAAPLYQSGQVRSMLSGGVILNRVLTPPSRYITASPEAQKQMHLV